MKLERGRDILLFYEKHKWDYVERYSKRSVSGFYSWYLRLCKCLRESGYQVHENNYSLAEENPNYPIGIVGTPKCIPGWKLKNPAILGPSMYDHPRINPNLMKDKRFRYYIVTCKWFKKIFNPYFGNRCVIWNAGIELDEWPDFKKERKTIDFLVYDKIKWNRDILVPQILEPILCELRSRNLTFEVLRYGNISHREYKDALARSRSMLFMCEYETQGMAYQEALACNLAVLAWDFGYWTDPQWQVYCDKPIRATSVPYFSPQCGARFKSVSDFPKILDKFLNEGQKFMPREFIEKDMSLRQSAEKYVKLYFSI
ncbi:MAG: hypothetical protein R2772_11055 [Chitinophagales bacterium]